MFMQVHGTDAFLGLPRYVASDQRRHADADFRLLRWPPQCLRRRFSEQRTVGGREAAKLPKAVITEDACDARIIGTGTQKRPTAARPGAASFFDSPEAAN